MSKTSTSAEAEKRLVESARMFVEYYARRGTHLLGNSVAHRTYVEMRRLLEIIDQERIDNEAPDSSD